jgi:hypothetical protein
MEAGGMGERRRLTAVGAKAPHRCQNPPETQTWRFAAQKGSELPPPHTRHEWDPKRRQTLSPRGWAKPGARGAWGVSPRPNPPDPLPCEGRGKFPLNWGWRGRSPLPGGLGDVPPKAKIGGEQPTPATPPRVGPKTLANPQPTGVGKTGVQGGRSPHGGGPGGVPPQSQRGASSPPLQPRHEWDPKPWQTLSPRGRVNPAIPGRTH